MPTKSFLFSFPFLFSSSFPILLILILNLLLFFLYFPLYPVTDDGFLSLPSFILTFTFFFSLSFSLFSLLTPVSFSFFLILLVHYSLHTPSLPFGLNGKCFQWNINTFFSRDLPRLFINLNTFFLFYIQGKERKKVKKKKSTKRKKKELNVYIEERK